jgi:hypothetical protein
MMLPPNFSMKEWFVHKRLHQGHFENSSSSSITTPHSCKVVLLVVIYFQEVELSFTRGKKVVVAKHISSDTNHPIRYTTSKVKIDA